MRVPFHTNVTAFNVLKKWPCKDQAVHPQPWDMAWSYGVTICAACLRAAKLTGTWFPSADYRVKENAPRCNLRVNR